MDECRYESLEDESEQDDEQWASTCEGAELIDHFSWWWKGVLPCPKLVDISSTTIYIRIHTSITMIHPCCWGQLTIPTCLLTQTNILRLCPEVHHIPHDLVSPLFSQQTPISDTFHCWDYGGGRTNEVVEESVLDGKGGISYEEQASSSIYCVLFFPY